MSTSSAGASMAGNPGGKTFFGHPRGLATLFFTEMWERFAYYGMRALLVLFMTAATDVANPGLGLDTVTAMAIYGLYTSLVYILALPGGWVADNLWGQRKAVFVGGCFIAAGQMSMALGYTPTFFFGLALIIIGTGLLKPNVSTLVGELYPEGGARRDAGFSIFYMGINLGAFLGPILTGYFGEGIRWQYGFGIGAIGMIAGLIQYKMGERHLGTAGLLKGNATPHQLAAKARKFYAIFGIVLAAVVAFGYSVNVGLIPVTLPQIATVLVYSVLVLVALYFIYLWTAGGHTPEENKRLGVIFWLFLLVAVFWSGFEQAGSSLNVFARDLTDRTIMGWLMPASFLQSVNALLIIIMAPVFGALWVWLDKRHVNPPLPLKAGFGLLGLSMGFFVIAWGAANATPDSLVSPSWLVVTYFLHTMGELCISPIGLSAITKLSPQKRVGQMMGIWFVGAAMGNLFAGLVAGRLGSLPPAPLFHTVALTIGGVGIIASLASPWIKKLMGGVK